MLSERAHVEYKCTDFYDPAGELGIVRPQEVRALYRSYCEGRGNVSYKQVLNVYTLETWLRRFEGWIQ